MSRLRRLVAYDIPLRPDMMIRITLPMDLTSEDADRVAGFVRTLVFDNEGIERSDITAHVLEHKRYDREHGNQ